jgi:hypothetical protein
MRDKVRIRCVIQVAPPPAVGVGVAEAVKAVERVTVGVGVSVTDDVAVAPIAQQIRMFTYTRPSEWI